MSTPPHRPTPTLPQASEGSRCKSKVPTIITKPAHQTGEWERHHASTTTSGHALTYQSKIFLTNEVKFQGRTEAFIVMIHEPSENKGM
jgi:hypothetical protein